MAKLFEFFACKLWEYFAVRVEEPFLDEGQNGIDYNICVLR